MQIYTVCLKNYDSLSSLHGPLYEARKSFQESGRKYKKAGEDVSDGMTSKYNAMITSGRLEWQKMCGHDLLEKSYCQKDSYCILKWDVQGRLVSKVSYTKRHNWIQNAYFEQTGEEPSRPKILLRPSIEGDGMERLDYDPEEKKYRRTELFPCPVKLGTAENSMINSAVGEPEIYVSSDEGDFCFCTQQELEKRAQAQKRLEEDVPSGEPKEWIPPELEKKFEAGDDIQESLLQRTDSSEEEFLTRNFAIGENSDDMPVKVDSFPAQEETLPSDLGALHQILNLEDVPETEANGAEKVLSEEGMGSEPSLLVEKEAQLGSYSADHEVFSVNVIPPEKEHASLDEESVKEDSDKDSPTPKKENGTDSLPSRYVVASKNSEGTVAGLENLTKRKTQEDDKTSENLLQENSWDNNIVSSLDRNREEDLLQEKNNVSKSHSQKDKTIEIDSNSVEEKKQETARESEPALEGMLPAKSIVISAQESYLYFGNLIDGLRQGRGRTQMANGGTAYEGDYVNDKRNGFGAYYYNTGRICYVGDWKENKRDGVGVSFRPQDSSMYVSRWKDDKPVGTASVFDRNGNLMFAGKIEQGERQGVGVSYNAEDGAVFVGKWKDNIPTGEGSAFDCEGNLLYTGGWKDGRRHGMGTEYSKEGAEVFVGLWEDNRRVRGIIYENGVPKVYPPQ